MAELLFIAPLAIAVLASMYGPLPVIVGVIAVLTVAGMVLSLFNPR
jgi:hypothetical protein